MKRIVIYCLLSYSLISATIGEISEFVGVRDNQLIGYGLVVGLNGTGDSSSSFYTYQSISNMLQLMNVKIDPASIKSKNVASVMVTAKLPPFTRQGDKISVVVSSIGDAKSLEGGTLIMTPLKGVDGVIYALAQGPISVGGISGRGGTPTHVTAGQIPNGAVVEREIPYDLYSQERIKLSLKEPSFSNAISAEKAINRYFGNKVATAIDPKTVNLNKPESMSMIQFLATVENIDINYKTKSKIVINERTGTIVSGVDIEVSPIVITHGKITIKVNPVQYLPQNGGTITRLDNDVAIDSNGRILTRKNQNNIANITRSLKKLGAKPQDIISIIQTMKEAGAIQADLEII
ncbi:MAG TPA: flagellar basal body P-ring protein FlgI [Campylobacterales bacterium]|nr:flagellar basal body P-ring protein FlgI [Campylobacterales bacterium]